MVKKWFLDLHSNRISNVAPLTTLTNLYWLNLALNQITDIAPLASLTNSITLVIHGAGNQIADWSPVSHVGTVRRP
jgi:internalin A